MSKRKQDTASDVRAKGMVQQSDGKQKRRPAKGLEEPTLTVTIPEAQHGAWYEVMRTYAMVSQSLEQRLLRAEQIPLHWYDVLLALEKAPEHRLRMSELAENVLTSPSNLTRLVDRLEVKGLLRREVCSEDRRVSYAVLTEAGASARLAAWPSVAGGIVELFASKVNDTEAHIIIEALRRVVNSETSMW